MTSEEQQFDSTPNAKLPQGVMKLDKEDYENIFLRIGFRLLKWLGSIVVGIGIAGTVYVSNYVGSKVDKLVDDYVKTEEFKGKVVAAATEKVAKLKQQTDVIEGKLSMAEKRTVELAKLPLYINNQRVAMMAPSGEKLYIEAGTVNEGGNITFASGFKKEPVVILSVIRNGLYLDVIRNARQGYIFPAPIVTSAGFSVPGNVVGRGYSWIAIGQ